MRYTTLFIDLDGTLYPAGNGMWELIAQRMNEYIHHHLQIPLEQVPELRRSYYQEYGTTLRGLQAHYDIDAEGYLAYVHDVPIAEYLQPDAELRGMLASLPQAKWVMTNSDHRHAGRVLDALGVRDLFEGVIDVWATGFVPKPDPSVYRQALAAAGEPAPGSCVLVDDIPKNLRPAQEMGLTTVLVGDKTPEDSHHYHIKTITELAQQVPALLE